MDEQLSRALRGRVADLRATTRRRVFPPCLEVVDPAGLSVRGWPVLAVWSAARPGELPDHPLRVEILTALLGRVSGGPDGAPPTGDLLLAWVRPGPPELGDSDLGWWSAARVAGPVAGRQVRAAYAVTRWGWLDIATGDRRTWTRLRRGPSPAAQPVRSAPDPGGDT